MEKPFLLQIENCVVKLIYIPSSLVAKVRTTLVIGVCDQKQIAIFLYLCSCNPD